MALDPVPEQDEFEDEEEAGPSGLGPATAPARVAPVTPTPAPAEQAGEQAQAQATTPEAAGAPAAPRKKYNSQYLKNTILDIVIDYVQPLNARIRQLEKSLKRKRGLDNLLTVPLGGNGICKGCNKRTKDNDQRLKPSNIKLALFGTSLARDTHPNNFTNDVIKCNKYCAECKRADVDGNRSYKWWFDISNKGTICSLCRCARARLGNMYCGDCDVDKLQRDHAHYKAPMHNAFIVLKEVVHGVTKVKTSLDFDKESGEMEVDGDFIDFVITIDMNAVKHMYFIEIMNTKTENLLKYSDKFAKAREKIQPNKSYLMAFDIKNTAGGYPLVTKIEIMRRWVIFTLLYSEYIPNITNWWFFCLSRNAYAMNDKNSTRFYQEPIRIDKAPRSLNGVPWEFATDMFAQLAEEHTLDVNQFMFNGNFAKGMTSGYSLYNSDKEPNALEL